MALITEDLIEGRIDKVAIAIDRIRAFEPPEGYYVAFSGGKDSVVILDLVKKAGVKFDAHYNYTTVDPPELYRFVQTFSEVEIRKPRKNMWKLIVEKGFPPTRMIRYCCAELKEGGGDGRMVLTGVRWAESSRRSARKMTEPCFRNSRIFYINPIIDWSDKDVWDYITQNSVRYCSLYDDGWKRLGCVLCPMSSNMKKEAERWPKIQAAYIRAFQKAIDAKRDRKITQRTGQEMYNWWVDQRRKKEDPDQTVMFE